MIFHHRSHHQTTLSFFPFFSSWSSLSSLILYYLNHHHPILLFLSPLFLIIIIINHFIYHHHHHHHPSDLFLIIVSQGLLKLNIYQTVHSLSVRLCYFSYKLYLLYRIRLSSLTMLNMAPISTNESRTSVRVKLISANSSRIINGHTLLIVEYMWFRSLFPL